MAGWKLSVFQGIPYALKEDASERNISEEARAYRLLPNARVMFGFRKDLIAPPGLCSELLVRLFFETSCEPLLAFNVCNFLPL
jgi:hypothetical protein